MALLAVTAVAADEPALKPDDAVRAVWPVMFEHDGPKFLPAVRDLKDYKEMDAVFSGHMEITPSGYTLPSGAGLEMVPDGMSGTVRRVLKPGETRWNDSEAILVNLYDGRALWMKRSSLEPIKPPAKSRRRRRRR